MPAQAPPDYSAVACAVTIFGCWPVGMVAQSLAQQASTQFALGDAAGAWRSAAKSRQWCLVGAIAGVLIWAAGIYAIAAMFAAAAAVK